MNLADRLDELSITPTELAAVTRIAPDAIAAYVAGDAEPDSDDAYLIRRALDGSYRAELAIDRVRRMQTESLLGHEATAAGISSFPKIENPVLDGRRPQ